ncbi:MAG: cell division protein ZapA [Negativicutes bacterium]|nr:cell division protein ZapA [Negativicutes bacterium]
MTKKKCTVTVEIFGDNYPLKGDIEPEKIMEVAQFVDKRMNQVAKANPRLPISRIAVLVALNMAEEYLRLEKDYRQMMGMLKDGKK